MEQKEQISETTISTCGIIMPISSIDNCSKEHWAEVKNILSEAIEKAGFKPCLVSDADDSGVIQKRIVQNIYDNDIVVCDVSCKNPNVMFELGMRLAFDKPTIIVIDDKTNYTFDTSVIEHLAYPRDLRYYSILEFQKRLKDKIIATSSRSKDDPNYTTFLKNFGEFEVAHIEKKKGSLDQAILSKLDDLFTQVNRIQKQRPSYFLAKPMVEEYDKLLLNKIIRAEINDFCQQKNIQDESSIRDDVNVYNEMFDKIFNSLLKNNQFVSNKTLHKAIDGELLPY